MWFRRQLASRNDDPDHEVRPPLLVRGFRWFVIIFAALLLSTLAIWVFTGTPEGPPPVIVGPETPERRAPEDQSSMVPNQDQPIYERVAPGTTPGRGEELLAEPERPLRQDEIVAQVQTERPAEPPAGAAADSSTAPVQTPAETSEPPIAPAQPPTAEPTEGGSEQPPQPPAPPTQSESPPASSPAPAAEAPSTSPPPSSGMYRIQIASVRTQEQAEAEWKRVADRYPDLLSRLKPIYERFETNNKGVYYRVQAGPLIDEALADLLCAQLTARKVGCFVIAP